MWGTLTQFVQYSEPEPQIVLHYIYIEYHLGYPFSICAVSNWIQNPRPQPFRKFWPGYTGRLKTGFLQASQGRDCTFYCTIPKFCGKRWVLHFMRSTQFMQYPLTILNMCSTRIRTPVGILYLYI